MGLIYWFKRNSCCEVQVWQITCSSLTDEEGHSVKFDLTF